MPNLTSMALVPPTAVDVISTLDLLADEFDFFSAEFRRCRCRIERQARRTGETDRQAILQAITEGYWRTDEISTHTRIPCDTVYRHLQALRRDKLIVRAKPDHGEPGKGGDRKSYLYKLKEA